MTDQPADRLRADIIKCFRDTYMETQGDTELFDTEETIDAIEKLFKHHDAEMCEKEYTRGYQAGYKAGMRGAALKNTVGRNHKHVYSISADQSDTGKDGVRVECVCGKQLTEFKQSYGLEGSERV